MRFGYHATMCDPSFYPALVKEAEAAGFDSFSIPDSLFYPQAAEAGQYPYNADGSRDFLDGVPFLDPFTLIAWLAGMTTRLAFTMSVLKLAIRQPVVCAKQALSHLTEGLFRNGLGVVTTQVDGKWYLSPGRSFFELVLTALRSLQPQDVDALLKGGR